MAGELSTGSELSLGGGGGGGGGGAGINALQMNLLISATTNNTVYRTINNVNSGLRSIQRQARMTSMALNGMTRNLIRMGTGLVLGGSVLSFLNKSLQLGKQAQNNTQALSLLLKNNLRLRGQDTSQAKEQLEVLRKQAHALQEQTGIYEQIYLKGDAMLATGHQSFEQIRKLQPYIANILVYQREMGKSAEQLEITYTSITRMLAVGQARGLSSIGIQMSPMDRKMAEAAALSGNKAVGRAIIEKYLMAFRGGALARMKTDLGQMDLALAHIQSTQANIGIAIIPVQQQLIIMSGQLIQMFGPALISGFTMLNQALMQHRDHIIEVAKKGWGRLTEAVTYFKRNSYWIVPWVLVATKVFFGWRIAMIALNTATIALSAASRIYAGVVWMINAAMAANPWVLAIAGVAALAAGIIYLTIGFDGAKKAAANFWEFIVGTKLFNSTESKGVMRGFKPGEVPRAQPVEKGMFSNMKGAWDSFVAHLSPSTKNALADITQQWNTFTQNFKTDLDGAQQTRLPQLLGTLGKIGAAFKWWDDMLFGTAIDVFAKGCDNLLIVVNKIHDAWKAIFEWFTTVNGGGPVKGTEMPVPYTGSGSRDAYQRMPGKNGGTTGINWAPNGLPIQTDANAHTLNAIYNNPGAMGPTKSALAYGATPSGHFDTGHPFMQFPTKELGAAAQFSMWWNGAYRNQTLAGAIHNWIGPGEHGEAEDMSRRTGIPLNAKITGDMLRGPEGIRIMQAQAKYEGQNVLTPAQWKAGQDEWKRRQGLSDPAPTGGVPSAGITIHNNVVYHVHGGDAVHQIAALHKKHIDQLSKDVAEAHYRAARSNFTNSIV